MNISLFIGLIGCFLGVAGGLAGTYLAVASASGPRERGFMVRAVVICWALVVVALAAMILVPVVRPLVWVGCAVALPLGLRWWSGRQRHIRRTEQAQAVSRGPQAVTEPDTTVE